MEVFNSMINKIRPECKVVFAPALQEYSRNYNNLIEKVKLWKKQGVKAFYFIINVILDKSGVKMSSSMESGNHWSCVHISLETEDGLYADSVGREVPRDVLPTFFKQYAKYMKKVMTLSNPCKSLIKFNQQNLRTNVATLT